MHRQLRRADDARLVGNEINNVWDDRRPGAALLQANGNANRVGSVNAIGA